MVLLTLTSQQRGLLSRAVTDARREAEAGAHESLQALGVDHHEPFGHMTLEQRALRNALRAHGRQLGDARDPKRGTQAIDHLAHEVAFEHWHRMLFARFLAENGLLIHPEHGVPVSIEDCIDLAKEQGQDPWALAASFAQDMLPQLFRKDDPALSVALPTNRRTQIEKLLADLPATIFSATDALGWTYQFWQADKKEEVNASGKKIGADELPAVTQLFTEDYMVDFLLDNTLGAWHAGKVLAAYPKLAESAQSEDELRQAVALPGCPWNYLRFIKDKDGKWTPAAGTFDGWPKTAKEITYLDPCMGSGHFVVAMFERLVALRMEQEKLDEKTAVVAVISDNLFGLEIDPRCTQIGAFNLALAAWRRVGHCTLPTMSLACSGLAPNTKLDDWLKLAGKNEKLQRGMERLYRLFKDAPVLGSLINPRVEKGDLLVAEFHELEPLLEKALLQETKDETARELAVSARGLAKAAEILAGQFTLVATNVPYLGRNKQDYVLAEYCEHVYPKAKSDLATCFVERCLNFCAKGGSTALVTPQNWLFLGTYKKLRQAMLTSIKWDAVVRLGEGGFESSQAAGAFTALLMHTRSEPSDADAFAALDASAPKTPEEKQYAVANSPFTVLSQKGQLANPDARITTDELSGGELLSKLADYGKGSTTGDRPRFLSGFWEFPKLGAENALWLDSPNTDAFWSGREHVTTVAVDSSQMQKQLGCWLRGQELWGRPGVAVNKMRGLQPFLYAGEIFDDNIGIIAPHDKDSLVAIWCFVENGDYVEAVRRIDQKLNVTAATLTKVPFDLAHWQQVAAEKYPHGLPKPFSSDPTQWLFNGQPKGSDQPLQVAVARLLGYQWPRQTGSSFPDCPALALDGLEKLADDDGIVPINPMRGEPAAEERVIALLRDAFTGAGVAFDQSVVTKLIADTGSKATSLTEWLLNDFFEQHCKLFHQRPFVWHIWDGRMDGFNVLVNYHRLAATGEGGRQLLEKVTYAYLKDWIDRQEAGVREGMAGAEARLAAAAILQKELKQILDGEAPYDIFVRWKSLWGQPIGWTPDINDGVRVNIRPFLLANDVGKKGAGILRARPNIKWTKDRGNELQASRPKADYPWFWGCDPESNPVHRTDFIRGREFTGERWNDLHYTLAAKKAARATKESSK